ncbi:MAG TPA: carbohydrate-binding protein [Lacisediminihabitans sp.]|uniref:chitinase n=1 Tax=Lacisediminihabitans sp. TaxID=2787631 RepID=UPI002ED7C105
MSVVPGAPRTRRRLSLPRLVVAVVVTAGVIAGSLLGVQWMTASAEPKTQAWFAGYADVTATPSFTFESPTAASGKNVVLSFIVSTPGDSCEPSWGGAYSLENAAASLDLDRRIARLQQNGGDVAVSFGGQAGNELATECTNVKKLAAAYTAVIERYRLTTIDLDVEGASLTDSVVDQRRAAALALVQHDRRSAGKDLAVWFTLPVSPTGLDQDGQTVVQDALAAKLDVAGVNAMTMDYGSSLPQGTSELAGTTQALTATERQLGILYRQSGTHLSATTLWSKIGVTPMIGQNDVRAEVFTLADAKALNAFVLDHGIGRVSMWSLNRDRSCGANYATLTVVSDACSGVVQSQGRFARLLSSTLTGQPRFSAGTITTAEPSDPAALKDDPATSPYAIWTSTGSYLKGTKVVWHHNVYQAKWWTSGDLPDNPVLDDTQTPWTLIGPVLKGEKPIPVPTLPAGTYPNWSDTTAYVKGNRVLFAGVPYEAKWWTQGESPDASDTASSDPDASPWVPLTSDQIAAVTADSPSS